MVTVSALSGLQGVEPQLQSHVSGARNMGLKDDEIRSIPATLAARVGEVEAWRAAKAIAAVFGEPFDEGKPVEQMMFPKATSIRLMPNISSVTAILHRSVRARCPCLT